MYIYTYAQQQELCRKCDGALHAEPAMSVHPRDEIDFQMPEIAVKKR